MHEVRLGDMDSRRAVMVRSLVFHVSGFPPELVWLMSEFRLIVNKSIRIAVSQDIRSRFRLSTAAYGQLSAEHDIHKQYIPSAFEVAMGALKGHRRRTRKGRRSSTPYMTRLMLKAENHAKSGPAWPWREITGFAVATALTGRMNEKMSAMERSILRDLIESPLVHPKKGWLR